MTRSIRVMLIPGRSNNVLNQLNILFNSVCKRVRFHIVGPKDLVEKIGRNIDKKFLKLKRVLLYRIDDCKDVYSEVFKAYITINPHKIIFFLRRVDDERMFRSTLFYPLATRADFRTVISYIDSGREREYIKLGRVAYNLRELVSLIEED